MLSTWVDRIALPYELVSDGRGQVLGGDGQSLLAIILGVAAQVEIESKV